MRPDPEPASTSGRHENSNMFAFVDFAALNMLIPRTGIPFRLPFQRASPRQTSRGVSSPQLAFRQTHEAIQRHGNLSEYLDLPGKQRSSNIHGTAQKGRKSGHVQRLHHSLKHCVKPKGPGGNDRSRVERVINVVTSLPFVIVGLHTARRRSTPEGRCFGSAIMATGVAAAAYHAASGRVRVALRKLDHWSISLTAAAMSRAVFPHPSRWRRALGIASVGLAPFQPFAVSAANFGLTELEFAKAAFSSSASSSPSFRRAYLRHTAVGAIGVSCYLLEDVAIEQGCDLVHPLWHCLACYAVAGTNLLIRQKEKHKLKL